MTSDRYVSFIYNMQFKRRISPTMFFLSNKGMRIILFAAAIYYLTEGKVLTVLSIALFVYAVKSYTESRLTFKSKLARYSKSDADSSLPIVAWFVKQKEKYIRQHLNDTGALIALRDYNYSELKEKPKEGKQ